MSQVLGFFTLAHHWLLRAFGNRKHLSLSICLPYLCHSALQLYKFLVLKKQLYFYLFKKHSNRERRRNRKKSSFICWLTLPNGCSCQSWNRQARTLPGASSSFSMSGGPPRTWMPCTVFLRHLSTDLVRKWNCQTASIWGADTADRD